MCQSGQQLLTVTKKVGELGRGEIVYCSGYNASIFYNLQKRSLVCREHGTLQICFPLGPRSGFTHYNLTTRHLGTR